jgi:SAM-dependent methyltransferase
MEKLLSEKVERMQKNPVKRQVCPCCGRQGSSNFFDVRNVPVENNMMTSTEEEALRFSLGDIDLALCDHCGFIRNTAFNPLLPLYFAGYEDQQGFSPTFNTYARDLSMHLIEKYDLYNKSVIEIGCGKGDFLSLFCKLGNNRGLGIDPLVETGPIEGEAADRVIFIRDSYSEEYLHYPADMVICRHTLEHIHSPERFLSTVRRTIGDRLDTIVFFEVPDVTRILRDLAYWDIYYEHCSYFSPGSLARLFRCCGFEVIDLALAYDDQYILIEAKPVKVPSVKVHMLEESIEQMTMNVQYFSSQISSKLAQWKQRLQQMHIQGKRTAIWGSGSKCVSFLTTLGMKDEIGCVVDINPNRHGKYIPGVGKEIVPPEFLRVFDPDEVIIMNPIYSDEIRQKLNNMGLAPEVIYAN